jgi:hypothetical protein
MLDVGATGEDALEVDPLSLNVDPHVEKHVDAIELLLPRHGVLFEHYGLSIS